MCGIAGIFSFKQSSFTLENSLIDRMRDTMLHRGPDGGSTWISPDKKLGLGHRRLSIIDLSNTAAQPMQSGDLTIVFNGEIYNHAEIRAELNRIAKPEWKTDHSDTEVILKAFAHWGIACLEKFRGMFAFALWDGAKQELWLVRDRIGVKPLYYSVQDNRIAFASEIKALLQVPGQKRAVDEDALFYYLSFLTTPAPQTLFAGIKKLPPATYLKISAAGQIEERRYWDVWDHTQPLHDASDAEIAERLMAELRTSVRYRGVSDVPVGVFLSGGIDSSLNATLFSENQSARVKTFTIGYDGSYSNENHYAKLVSERIRAEYHEQLLSPQNLIDFLPRMITLQDEPIADPVCVPVYYVSQLARDNGVIVCQLGEGADELFWGYEGWRNTLRLEKLGALPSPLLKTAAFGLKALGRGQTWPYEKISRLAHGYPVFWGGAEAFTQAQKLAVLSTRLRAKFAHRSAWEALEPFHENFQAKAWEKSAANWMSYLDLSLRIPELLLMRVDKMSMGASLEARVPFLDHKFVELAMSIPAAVKTRGGISKAILKKSARGLIPDEIIDRKKQGFAVPIHEWLLGKLGEQVKTAVREFATQTDYLDRNEADRILESGTCHHQWYLFNLALWWKNFIAV